jgi:glycosyltransferase involved in cell wall biosynthesis
MRLDHFAGCQSPSDWRERIGGWPSEQRPRIVLMLAAFEPRKRHRSLLEAFAPLLRERTDICLLLAGDGPLRRQCQDVARSLGIAERVRMPGHDHAPEELVQLADVCVFASEREGLPRAVVQYIAGGKPVVLTELPGIDEIIADGVNGVIVRADDLKACASEVLRLLDDGARLEGLSAAARSTDVSTWDQALMGERLDAVYARALASGEIARRSGQRASARYA